MFVNSDTKADTFCANTNADTFSANRMNVIAPTRTVKQMIQTLRSSMAVDKAATSLATSRMGFWRAANESPANGITAGARGVSHGPLRGPTDPWWSASELNSAKASRVGSGRQYSATDASDAITQP